ncbi:MAG: hypothetical protein ACI3ZZ_01730 [Candidatus Aphodosoma sp.]
MKKYLSTIIASFVFISLFGQQTKEKQDTAIINRDIQIEKEYTPDIKESKRSNIEYKAQEYTITPTSVNYSTYSNQVTPKSIFYPLAPQNQNVLKHKEPSKGYALIGAGYYLNWDAEFFYPIIKSNSTDLSIFLDHDAYYDIKNSPFDDHITIDTKFEMDYRHRFRGNQEIYSSIGYDNNYYSYYGGMDSIHMNKTAESVVCEMRKDSLLPEMQCIHKIKAELGLRSLEAIDGWNYDANIRYRAMFLQYMNIHEHLLDLNGKMSHAFGKNDLEVGLSLSTNFYNKTKGNDSTYRKDYNNVDLGLAPAYIMRWNNIDFRLGFKIYFAFMKHWKVNAMPDIQVNYNYKKLLNVYGGVTGEYHNVSKYELLEANRYFNPYSDVEYNHYVPVKPYLGLMIKPVNGMLINIFAEYKYVVSEYQFINNGRMFEAQQNAYSHTVNVGGRINYNLKDKYNFYASGIYHMYIPMNMSISIVHRPIAEATAGFNMNPYKGLNIYADFYFAYGRYYHDPASEEPWSRKLMKNIYDLNIGISYNIKPVTIFLEGKNLVGFSDKLNYDVWQSYSAERCISIGAKFEF